MNEEQQPLQPGASRRELRESPQLHTMQSAGRTRIHFSAIFSFSTEFMYKPTIKFPYVSEGQYVKEESR